MAASLLPYLAVPKCSPRAYPRTAHFMCVCIHTHTHVYIHIYKYIYMHTHTHTHTIMYTIIYNCIHFNTYTSTNNTCPGTFQHHTCRCLAGVPDWDKALFGSCGDERGGSILRKKIAVGRYRHSCNSLEAVHGMLPASEGGRGREGE